MAAYELSTSTLKTLLANPLLDQERVDSATDALAESLADQREIDEAIQQGSQVAIGANGRVLTDDDELEKELADMVRDEKERVEAEKQAEQAAERLQREDELERKRMGADAARLAGLASPPVAAARTGDGKVMPDQTGSRTAGSEWEERYAASRAREIAEKGRAEVERLQKEEERTKRVAAE
jgi:charged multivesicular body protein 7